MRIYIKPNTREAFAGDEKRSEVKKLRKTEVLPLSKYLTQPVKVEYNSRVDEEFEDLERRYGPEEGP
jgi:hypothetical protein